MESCSKWPMATGTGHPTYSALSSALNERRVGAPSKSCCFAQFLVQRYRMPFHDRRMYERSAIQALHLPAFKIQEFQGDVPLVVIHADNRIEAFPANGQVKQRIGWEWPLNRHAFALSPLHRRYNFLDF